MPVKIQVFKCDLQCVSQRIEYYDLELLRGKKMPSYLNQARKLAQHRCNILAAAYCLATVWPLRVSTITRVQFSFGA